MFKTIGVRFIGQTSHNEKDYSYFTDLTDLVVGDTVVVDTVNGFKTATVTLLCADETSACRWVVCKVNAEAFKEKLEELKRKQFILRQMKDRLDQVNLLERCQEAAKVDEEMAKLFAAFTDNHKLIGDKK